MPSRFSGYRASAPRRRRLDVVLAIVAGLALLPGVARGQGDTATISGRIADQSGQAVPQAVVRVLSVDSGVEITSHTNPGGLYVVRSLRPGLYRVEVEQQGFKSVVLDGLVLDVGSVLGRNFTLELGEMKDTVTVTAGIEEQNLSPAVSTVVDRQFIEQMPLNGRSFQSLIHLTPGVLVSASTQGLEGQFSTNGQRTNTNYFTVDGVTINFAANLSVNPGQNIGGSLPTLTIGGGTNSFISVDAMQEFRTQTSGYAAEFGRMPGAQISIVTRSGTNRFHGTAYTYFRDDALDSRGWFNPPPEPEPPQRQTNFGGTVGGPILPDQSFFFFSYEGLRLEQPVVQTGQVYTPETRAAAAPVYQPFVAALPVPTGPPIDPSCDNVTTPCLASFTTTFANHTSFDAFSLRLDQNLKQRVMLFVRGSHTPSAAGEHAFATLTVSRRNSDLVTGGLTAVLTSRLLNDLRIGWGRSVSTADVEALDANGAVPPPAAAMFPQGVSPSQFQVAVTLPGGGGSITMGRRARNAARQVNVVNSLSVVGGAHHVKMGVDYRQLQPTAEGSSLYIISIGNFSQLKAGTLGSVSTAASESITARLHNWSLFAQDTWELSNRLTLTSGLRWDVNTPPVSITPGKPLYAIQGIFDAEPLAYAPPGTPLWHRRYNNVAPRLGAAYHAAPSTIVRGGFGVFYDMGYGGMLGRLITGFPYTRSSVTAATGLPFDLASPIFTVPPVATSLTSPGAGVRAAFDPNLQLPVTLEWHAGIEQELGPRQAVSVTYLGSSGRRLLRADFVVPGPTSFPQIPTTRNAGQSRYDALQVQFRRRLHHGVQALLSYTLANARDTGSDDVAGTFLGAPWNAEYAASVDELRLPALSPANFDIRHAFSAAASYDLPSPATGRVWRAVLSDWSVDTIVRASSPPPLNVRVEGESPTLGSYRTQPDLVPGQPIWLAAPDEPGGRMLNMDAFRLPVPGTSGNLPRNSIRSPFSINQTDLSVRRRVRFNPTLSADFRVEFYNLFNRAMFGGPLGPSTVLSRCSSVTCNSAGSSGFGKVSSGGALNQTGLGGDSLSGGQNALYSLGAPRSIQLSAKLLF